MQPRFHGQVAIIIGATRGIGLGIAKDFAKEGASLVLTGRDRATLAPVVEEIQSLCGSPDQVLGVTADISKKEDVTRLIEAAKARFGRIDVLCQNAGIFPEKSVEDATKAHWDEVMGTNAEGTLWAMQACFPIMKAQNYGRIVIISSITGPRTAIPNLAVYAASKGAINAMVKVAALEGAPFGITVNAVEPGNIITPGLEKLGPEYLTKMTEAIPLGKLGKPEDIGHAVMFFADKRSEFITGTSLIVDGGQTLPESRSAILPTQSTTLIQQSFAQNPATPKKTKPQAKKPDSESAWYKQPLTLGSIASVAFSAATLFVTSGVSSRLMATPAPARDPHLYRQQPSPK